ncbi:hypothetical protein CPB97_000273 [Podila verticillata]|nr:hypothetical protein CPB97_000273 [Podila verticillata]
MSNPANRPLDAHHHQTASTNAHRETPPPLPRVIIVGGGLGGLLLAVILEQVGIPYTVFERSSEIKPLGAIMCLNSGILPVFEQLGLFEDLMRVSLPCHSMNIFQENMKKISEVKMEGYKNLVGYDFTVFARPELHHIFASRIPRGKLLFGKKVLSIKQNADGVIIRCSDNSSYQGDILVGADGAYSAVRQTLYKQLSRENKLPQCDEEQMSINYSIMVGTTNELDPEKYTHLKLTSTYYALILANKGSPLSWSTFTVPGNRICWSAQVQLDRDTSQNESFRNSEWGPETNEAFIKEVYHGATPYGHLGDLIDQTPKDKISRVFLEDKLFETWNSGRVVLIGDAAHKLLPSAGQGAVSAMQDAVILANCIYDLTALDTDSVAAALKDYRDQRYPHVKSQYDASKMNAKILLGQKWTERFMRNVIFNYLPRSIHSRNAIKDNTYRPQINFLPQCPNRGTGPVLPQKPSKRYTELTTVPI